MHIMNVLGDEIGCERHCVKPLGRRRCQENNKTSSLSRSGTYGQLQIKLCRTERRVSFDSTRCETSSEATTSTSDVSRFFPRQQNVGPER
jgi:hypothetical protein